MLAFRFEDFDLQSNFEKYFSLELENWSWNYQTNNYESREFIQLEKCTKEHFGEDNYLNFQRLDM